MESMETEKIRKRLIESSKDYIANYPKRLKDEVELYESEESDYIGSELSFYKKKLNDVKYPDEEQSSTLYEGVPFPPLEGCSIATDIANEIGEKLFINRTQRKVDFLHQRIKELWLGGYRTDQPTNEEPISEPQPNEITPTQNPDKLTLKQQMLLLDLLGVFDKLKGIETTKKSVLISSLIDKDEQNVRTCLTYYGSNSKENPFHNPDNPKKVIPLLEKSGLPEIASKVKEQHEEYLARKKANSAKTNKKE